MAKTPQNTGKVWTPSEQIEFRKLVKQNTPTRIIALKLGRSASAIQNKASNLGVSLKPTNQSPYGKSKK